MEGSAEKKTDERKKAKIFSMDGLIWVISWMELEKQMKDQPKKDAKPKVRKILRYFAELKHALKENEQKKEPNKLSEMDRELLELQSMIGTAQTKDDIEPERQEISI